MSLARVQLSTARFLRYCGNLSNNALDSCVLSLFRPHLLLGGKTRQARPAQAIDTNPRVHAPLHSEP